MIVLNWRTTAWNWLSVACLVLGPTALSSADLVPGAVHNWVAGEDATANNLWEDNGTQADRNWQLSGPQRIAVDGPGIITHAYQFDGVADSAFTAAENRSGVHDTSFELWFRPSALPSGTTVRPIFEHGNDPRGVSFGLRGDTLVFVYGANPNFGSLTFDLDVGDDGLDNGHFIQAVGVVDDTTDQIRLFVDGQAAASRAIATTNDFTSNDDLGLGSNQSQGGGGQNAPGFNWGGSYAGDIAILREYRFDFTAAEALQNYRHVTTPEPSALALVSVGVVLIALARRRGGRHVHAKRGHVG